MKTLRILVFLLIIINFFFLGYLASEFTGKAVYETEKANLTRVIDGDTIDTNLGKVRLLGINTPEKNEKNWEEAKLFLMQFEGKEIELARTNEDKDKYNRLLRYAFYSNQLINQEILQEGLAHLYVYNEDDFTKKLEKAEEKARKAGLGIWEKSKDECASCIKLNKLNEIDPDEYIILENICNFDCNLQNWMIKDDSTKTRVLDFSLNRKESKRIDYEGRVWNDAGDSFYLRDEKGLLVVFYRY